MFETTSLAYPPGTPIAYIVVPPLVFEAKTLFSIYQY